MDTMGLGAELTQLQRDAQAKADGEDEAREQALDTWVTVSLVHSMTDELRTFATKYPRCCMCKRSYKLPEHLPRRFASPTGFVQSAPLEVYLSEKIKPAFAEAAGNDIRICAQLDKTAGIVESCSVICTWGVELEKEIAAEQAAATQQSRARRTLQWFCSH
jgi:hypothetical protein